MDGFSPDEHSSSAGAATGDPVQVGSFRCDDPWVQEQAVVPWDLAVQPISRGQYQTEVTFLASAGLILSRERYATRTRLTGLSPPDMLCFVIPLQASSSTSWWQAPLHETGLPFMMPGGLDVDMAAGQRHLEVLVDVGLFKRSLPAALTEAIAAANCRHVLPASRGAVARLGATLNALLDGAQAAPRALSHPNAIRSVQQVLLHAFHQSLTLPLRHPRRVGRASRQRGLQRAVEYLRYADAGSVTVAELCRVAQVTQRTLEYAFRESFGLSPLGIIQLRRFQATQRALLAANSGSDTVTEIALRNGFYNMGRFAIRYKEFFGESPSHTLSRPPIELQCRLPRPTELCRF